MQHDPEEIEALVSAHPLEAERALTRLRMSVDGDMPDLNGLAVASAALNQSVEETWIAALVRRDLLDAFVLALKAQGIGLEDTEDGLEASNFERRGIIAFLRRAETFRCRITRNGAPSGSGILVGPSTVLTAWHVLAVAPPGHEQHPAPTIEVDLADGRRIEAAIPARYERHCTEREWQQRLPVTDDEVGGHDDVALLTLKEPAGLHLAVARVASPAYSYPGNAAMVLVHYPEGEDRGVTFGVLSKLRGLTARWGHTLVTKPGSSGGGCFDTAFQLIGIHQGARSNSGGRLVPAVRFPAELLEFIAADDAPEIVWSLDGSAARELVIGRDAFFHAYAAARRKPRARGIWIKRTDLTRDVSGLPFSYSLIERMIARTPEIRLMRVGFDALVDDLPNEIARRATEAGFPMSSPVAHEGVGPDQTQEEAVSADRCARLASSLQAATLAQNVQLWIFFDHPTIIFGDHLRWALTSFIDQSLRMKNLRVVLAGYETMQMPGQQFFTPYDAEGQGPLGLMVEYLTGFTRSDVRQLIFRATRDLGREASQERVEEWTDEALAGLNAVGGVYDGWRGATVGERVKVRLAQVEVRA